MPGYLVFFFSRAGLLGLVRCVAVQIVGPAEACHHPQVGPGGRIPLASGFELWPMLFSEAFFTVTVGSVFLQRRSLLLLLPIPVPITQQHNDSLVHHVLGVVVTRDANQLAYKMAG